MVAHRQCHQDVLVYLQHYYEAADQEAPVWDHFWGLLQAGELPTRVRGPVAHLQSLAAACLDRH